MPGLRQVGEIVEGLGGGRQRSPRGGKMLEGKFDKTGALYFEEAKRKPFDARRLQAAMFMDRPDLWKAPARKRRKAAPPEQQPLL